MDLYIKKKFMEENTEKRVDLTLFSEKIQELKDRIASVIVGQEQMVDLVLTAVLANGLLVSMPVAPNQFGPPAPHSRKSAQVAVQPVSFVMLASCPVQCGALPQCNRWLRSLLRHPPWGPCIVITCTCNT